MFDPVARDAARTLGDLVDARDMIGDLRAVLGPLLDEPYQSGGPYFAPTQECRFCRAILGDVRHGHYPTCPVLRRDALLGRIAKPANGVESTPT